MSHLSYLKFSHNKSVIDGSLELFSSYARDILNVGAMEQREGGYKLLQGLAALT